VGMVQAGDRFRLALKPPHGLFIGHHAEPQDLDRDATVERGLFGLVDNAHSASPELADDPEFAQDRGLLSGKPCRPVDELDTGKTRC
jgi:hypothetical protein